MANINDVARTVAAAYLNGEVDNRVLPDLIAQRLESFAEAVESGENVDQDPVEVTKTRAFAALLLLYQSGEVSEPTGHLHLEHKTWHVFQERLKPASLRDGFYSLRHPSHFRQNFSHYTEIKRGFSSDIESLKQDRYEISEDFRVAVLKILNEEYPEVLTELLASYLREHAPAEIVRHGGRSRALMVLCILIIDNVFDEEETGEFSGASTSRRGNWGWSDSAAERSSKRHEGAPKPVADTPSGEPSEPVGAREQEPVGASEQEPVGAREQGPVGSRDEEESTSERRSGPEATSERRRPRRGFLDRDRVPHTTSGRKKRK